MAEPGDLVEIIANNFEEKFDCLIGKLAIVLKKTEDKKYKVIFIDALENDIFYTLKVLDDGNTEYNIFIVEENEIKRIRKLNLKEINMEYILDKID